MRRRSTVQPSFADLELRVQGVQLEPVLEKISRLLDRHGELVDLVYRDLRRGLKHPGRGRRGLTAEQVLRSFILKSIKDWDLRELRERIADGLTLRLFTAFYAGAVPRHQTLHSCFARLTPATLQALNAVLVQAAVDLGLEQGKWLRVDTTVVETDIHFPTDSSLLWDSVRVLTRLMASICSDVPQARAEFANRSRRAHRRMQEISRMTPHQRQRQLKRKYRDLLTVTAEVACRARRVIEIARRHPPRDLLAALRADWCCKEIERFAILAERVMSQAERRVFAGEVVPAEQKIYSIFEPHTDLIKRGKAHKPVEFGHKVLLAESRIGLITDYCVIEGNPGDDIHVQGLLERHLQRFGQPPALFAGDRGFFSTHGIEHCRSHGVKHECLPQRGGRKTPEREAYEKTRAFRRGQRFRAGVEGRISVLFRGRGMKRCLLEGRERFEVFVGAAVLANNLLVLAEQLRRRDQPRRRAA
jgi:transposase, IS5 family